MSASVVASVVGIASGVSNLLGGGGSSSGAGNVAGGAYYDSFASSRGQYANQLNQLMANPSSVTQTPGYQFGMNQGQEALNRNYAATGQGGSGAQQVGLQQFAQNYAGQQFGQQQSNLAQLSGATQSPMNVTGQNQLNQQGQQQGLSNIMGGLSGLSNSNFGSFFSNNNNASPGIQLGYNSSGNITSNPSSSTTSIFDSYNIGGNNQ